MVCILGVLSSGQSMCQTLQGLYDKYPHNTTWEKWLKEKLNSLSRVGVACSRTAHPCPAGDGHLQQCPGACQAGPEARSEGPHRPEPRGISEMSQLWHAQQKSWSGCRRMAFCKLCRNYIPSFPSQHLLLLCSNNARELAGAWHGRIAQ